MLLIIQDHNLLIIALVTTGSWNCRTSFIDLSNSKQYVNLINNPRVIRQHFAADHDSE